MPPPDSRALRAQHGMVLILALLSLLAFQFLAVGFLFVATQESLVAEAWTRHVRSRYAAESALRMAAAEWSSAAHAGLQQGAALELAAGTSADGVPYVVHAERLADGRFLLRATARLPLDGAGGAAVAVASWRIQALRLEDVFGGLAGAVTTHGALTIDGGAIVDPEDSSTAACAERMPGARGAVVADSIAEVDVGEALLGEPALVAGEAGEPAPAPLGVLSWDAIEAAANTTAEGVVQLQHTVEDGVCLTEAVGNWGSPLDPGGPCGSFFPLIYAPGDLVVSGGAGQGVLVVRGNLTLQPGVRFHGPVVVGGALMAEDALIDGALRIAVEGTGSPSELIGGSVRYRRCALLAALEGSALDGAFRPDRRLWIPAFD